MPLSESERFDIGVERAALNLSKGAFFGTIVGLILFRECDGLASLRASSWLLRPLHTPKTRRYHPLRNTVQGSHCLCPTRPPPPRLALQVAPLPAGRPSPSALAGAWAWPTRRLSVTWKTRGRLARSKLGRTIKRRSRQSARRSSCEVGR